MLSIYPALVLTPIPYTLYLYYKEQHNVNEDARPTKAPTRLKHIAVSTRDMFEIDPRIIKVDPGFNLRDFGTPEMDQRVDRMARLAPRRRHADADHGPLCKGASAFSSMARRGARCAPIDRKGRTAGHHSGVCRGTWHDGCRPCRLDFYLERRHRRREHWRHAALNAPRTSQRRHEAQERLRLVDRHDRRKNRGEGLRGTCRICSR